MPDCISERSSASEGPNSPVVINYLHTHTFSWGPLKQHKRVKLNYQQILNMHMNSKNSGEPKDKKYDLLVSVCGVK